MATDITAEHNIRIKTLENDFTEVKNSLAAIASESRQGLANLSAKIDETVGKLSATINASNETPWPILISGGSLILTIVTVIGSVVIVPMRGDIEKLSMNMVPRVEIDRREADVNRRGDALQAWIARVEQRQWEATIERAKSLASENEIYRRRMIEAGPPR